MLDEISIVKKKLTEAISQLCEVSWMFVKDPEDVLDAINGKKRAITLLIYNRASEKILSKLPEDAILIKVNNALSKTTILERASPQFFALLESFGTSAKILEPQDVVGKFMQWQKQKLYDYARLYKMDLDDIPVNDDIPGGLGI